MRKKRSKLDVFDMMNFYKFFKNLYSKETLSKEKLDNIRKTMSSTSDDNNDEELTDLKKMLDMPITSNELMEMVKAAKKGKAVAEDLISNEFIKASGPEMLKAILHLFNESLRLGVYPWNTSLVTPIHKKGSLYDPDNYRAIVISSILGKLFSSILLQRLVKFRANVCPDTPNQLGFCKNAQTADHTLTLSTCIEKYVNANNARLYTCFSILLKRLILFIEMVFCTRFCS